MNSKDWYRGLEHPESLGAADAAWLKQAVDEYPYSAPLHALYARALKNEGHYLAPQALRRAAAVAPDRRALMVWMEDFSVLTAVAEVPTPSAPQPVTPAPSPSWTDAAEHTKHEEPVVPTIPHTIPKVAVDFSPEIVAAPRAEPLANPESSLAGSDLSHLPDKVREAIVRARALTAKLKGSTASASASAEVRQEAVDPAQQRVAPLSTIPVPAPTVGTQALPVDVQAHPVVAIVPPATPATPTPPAVSAVQAVPELAVRQADSLHPVASDRGGGSNRDGEANSGLSPFARWLAEQAGSAPQMEPSAGLELDSVLPEAVHAPLESDAVVSVPTVPKPVADALINKFLEREAPVRPAAVPGRGSEARAPMPDLSASSLGGDPVFMTETLAQVYEQQGAFDKAVQAYEILRLKYPDKSAIFASRILEIRLKQRNKKS